MGWRPGPGSTFSLRLSVDTVSRTCCGLRLVTSHSTVTAAGVAKERERTNCRAWGAPVRKVSIARRWSVVFCFRHTKTGVFSGRIRVDFSRVLSAMMQKPIVFVIQDELVE